MANFKRNSRYTNGKKTKSRNNISFIVLRNNLNLEKGDNDIFVTVDQNLIERPDLIAYKAYKNVDLWWVIYEFNNIIDPFFDLIPGQKLRIPSIERVLEAISNLGKD